MKAKDMYSSAEGAKASMKAVSEMAAANQSFNHTKVEKEGVPGSQGGH
jgi:hypothetical protein